MKRLVCAITVLSLLLLARGAHAGSGASAREEGEGEPVERTAAVAPGAVIGLCVGTGDVVVRGWDKGEVRARAHVERLELRTRRPGRAPGRANVPSAPNFPGPPNTPGPASPPGMPNPPSRMNAPNPLPPVDLEVLMSNSAGDEPGGDPCGVHGDIELDVPRGATVLLRVREGDADISDVAEVRVESMVGETDVRGVTRAVEVESMSGSIFVRDSAGRVRLRTFRGDVEAINLRAAAAGDQFQAKCTNGSVTLEGVRHAHVEAATVSGDVTVTGPLTRGGNYDFQTFNGDVTLMLPAAESFKLNARVAIGGEITTDFDVKGAPGPPPVKELPQGRLVGTVGGGGAEVNLSSFNGALRLKKQ